MAKLSALKQTQEAYLAALAAHPEHNSREVASSLGLAPHHITEMRKSDTFTAREVAIVEGHPLGAASVPRIHEVQLKLAKDKYLEALRVHDGGRRAACKDANITFREYEAMSRNDPAFREAETEVLAELCEGLETDSTRMARRDPQHMRWLLAKLIPDRYADKPKKVEHHHKGSLSITTLDAEIEQLLDGEEAELLEGP